MSGEWIRGTCGGKNKWHKLPVKRGGLKTWSPSWNATNMSGKRFKNHITHKLSKTRRMGQKPTAVKKQEKLGRRQGRVCMCEYGLGEGCVCVRRMCEYLRYIWDVCEKWVCMTAKCVWMYVYIKAVCVWGVCEVWVNVYKCVHYSYIWVVCVFVHEMFCVCMMGVCVYGGKL